MQVTIALLTRQAKGNWSIEPVACLCTSNVARQDAAESARSGIFSKTRPRTTDLRRLTTDHRPLTTDLSRLTSLADVALAKAADLSPLPSVLSPLLFALCSPISALP